uniref:CCHC-type domain-containing protein n=1 Tax=Peronospora matthiolae TaxID=2874970 RepID=A0AAV1THT9_9STRA
MEASGSVRVFDGTTDFRVWRARVENELMRYHLLGYVMVRGYDGSQAFVYNGEEVPPRTLMIQAENEQLQQQEQQQQQLQMVKEEAPRGDAAPVPPPTKLSRWDVLGESAEAKSILQRCLHPDVEGAILNKNIYDSWKMLCALYGNRSSHGAHDVNEMHRVLHHIRLGDKKGEPVREFVTRWEMLMQQYALATGIELTDGFRSVSFVQTLPSAWRAMVTSWRGVRPFVPYSELVEKVIATRDKMQAQMETASATNSLLAKPTRGPTDSSLTLRIAQSPRQSVDKSAAVEPVTTPVTRALQKTVYESGDDRRAKSASEFSENAIEKPAKHSRGTSVSAEKAARPSKAAPSPTEATSGASDNVEPTSGGTSSATVSGKSKTLSRTRSADSVRKAPAERPTASRSSKSQKPDSRHEKNDGYEPRERYEKYDLAPGYDEYEFNSRYDKYVSNSRYDRSPLKSRSRCEKKYESYDRYDGKNGFVSCFYCLKLGHHMKRCWYLEADIENGTTHDPHKKFSCALTPERTRFMVNCLEAYIDEVNRERAIYEMSASMAGPRNHGGGYESRAMEGMGRDYHSQHHQHHHHHQQQQQQQQHQQQEQESVPPPPPGQPPANALHQQQQQQQQQQEPSGGAEPSDYRKRSHSETSDRRKRSRSAFHAKTDGSSASCSQDPCPGPSHRSGDTGVEALSPRKRSRPPGNFKSLSASDD